MKKISTFLLTAALGLGLLAGPALAAPERIITDHAGRTVSIPAPEDLNKVYVTSPLGFIFVYTLASDKLAGLPMQLSDLQKSYMDAYVANLPYLGGMQAGAELNREAILREGTQVFLSIGPNSPTATDVSTANELQAQLGIPVVVVDSSMDKISESYRFLGEMFGKRDLAEKLASYCEAVFKDVVGKISALPEDQKVSVYYAEQAEGLTTEPATSSHAAVLVFAGARNVADVAMTPGSGMSPVSLEQVLSWNPEVIIAWSDAAGGAYSMIQSNPDWSTISAVQNGRIYAMPNVPFSWMDRPPSVNRFLGIQWMANLLYPDIYDVDIVQQAIDFYSLFYHVNVSEAEMRELLKDSLAD